MKLTLELSFAEALGLSQALEYYIEHVSAECLVMATDEHVGERVELVDVLKKYIRAAGAAYEEEERGGHQPGASADWSSPDTPAADE
jgi:hypothetical protein